MTIPSTYLRNTTGGAFTSAKVGGVAAGINSTTDTTNGQPITRTHTVMDNAIEGDVRRTLVIENTGENVGAYNATKAISGGTFAYDQVEFMIRGHAETINGSANTAIRFTASAMRRAKNAKREKMYGVKSLTAWRNRGWQPLGVSGQRSNWDSSATGVNTNGILDALNDTFKSTTNNAVDSSDDAANPQTSAAPAELAYQFGGTTVNQDEYANRELN
jgi:hypothetical protein